MESGSGHGRSVERRVEALEARLDAAEERLAAFEPSDRVHPVVCAHEFRLVDEDGEERAVLGSEDEGSAQLFIGGAAGSAVVRADPEGSVIALLDDAGAIRFFANYNSAHGAGLGVRDHRDVRVIELTEFPGGAGALFRDSQDRQRIILIAGGRTEDIAELSLADGLGEEGVLFRVPAVRSDKSVIAGEGWPLWVSEELHALRARLNALEKGGQ